MGLKWVGLEKSQPKKTVGSRGLGLGEIEIRVWLGFVVNPIQPTQVADLTSNCMLCLCRMQTNTRDAYQIACWIPLRPMLILSILLQNLREFGHFLDTPNLLF